MKHLITAAAVALVSPSVLAHNSETASSLHASLLHQFTAPEHVLPLVAVLVLAAYAPALYRRIRNRK
jgi:hydrogenase/urease accessory protein HupE